MTSLSQWRPRYNRLKATITTPAITGIVSRACIPPTHLNYGRPRTVTRSDGAESCYSPVNCGGRLAKVAEIPSDRSLDGRKAAFHAAT
jgi:hypothetical protein